MDKSPVSGKFFKFLIGNPGHDNHKSKGVTCIFTSVSGFSFMQYDGFPVLLVVIVILRAIMLIREGTFFIGGGGLEPERRGSFIKSFASLRGGSHLSLKANPGEGHPNSKFHSINFKNII